MEKFPVGTRVRLMRKSRAVEGEMPLGSTGTVVPPEPDKEWQAAPEVVVVAFDVDWYKGGWTHSQTGDQYCWCLPVRNLEPVTVLDLSAGPDWSAD